MALCSALCFISENQSAMNKSQSVAGRPVKDSRYFFSLLHVFCALIAMFGFVPVYYLPLLQGNANFPGLVHLHAFIATTWLILFVIQPLLIRRKRYSLHQRLGWFTFFVGLIFVPVTIIATIGMLLRHNPPGALELGVFFPQMGSVFLFISFLVAGILYRRRGSWHKRFMTMTTIATLGTPIARIGFLDINQQPPLMVLLWNLPALLLIAYDLWLSKRIHRVTLVCFALLFGMQLLALYLMENSGWRTMLTRFAESLR